MEESSDIKKVLDSFSDSVSRGFTGTRDFIHKQVKVPIVVEDQKKTETLPKEPSAFPALMKTGGKLKYWKDGGHRLSRPSSNIDPELLERANYDDSDFCGSFGWKTPSGKYAEGYLLKLDLFDQGLVDKIRLKQGEKVFRYINRQTAIGGMKPFIKINLEKDLLYFLDSFGSEQGDVVFETRGVKADFINLIEGKFAKGGTTMKKRYKVHTYYGGEQSDEVHYVDTLSEARTLAAQAEHAEIIDQNTNEEVFAGGGMVKVLTSMELSKGIEELDKISKYLKGKGIRNYVDGQGQLFVYESDADIVKAELKRKSRFDKGGKAKKYEVVYDPTDDERGEIVTPFTYETRQGSEPYIIRFRKLYGDMYSFASYNTIQFNIEAITPHRATLLAIERLKAVVPSGFPTSRYGKTFEVSGFKYNEVNDKITFAPSFMENTHTKQIMTESTYQTKKGDLLRYDGDGDGFDFWYHVDNNGNQISGRLKGRILVSMLGEGIIMEKKSFAKGGKTAEWIYWRVEKGDYTVYEKTNPASPNIPNAKRISKEEYEANIRKKDEYAKGGVTENLVKELHKLQRELNSSRLLTYREGDNSPEEQARQRERASKLARFNEVLKLLNESGSKFTGGGVIYGDSYSEKGFNLMQKHLEEALKKYNFKYSVENQGKKLEYVIQGIDIHTSITIYRNYDNYFGKFYLYLYSEKLSPRSQTRTIKEKKVLDDFIKQIAQISKVMTPEQIAYKEQINDLKDKLEDALYMYGDSDEEMKEAIKTSKFKNLERKIERLELEYSKKFAKGGKTDFPDRNERKNKTYYHVIWDDGKSVKDATFENKDDAEELYDELVGKNYQPVHLSKDTFNEYGWLEKHNTYRMHPKFAKGGTTQMPYYSNMTKQEILTKTVVYDNGGESMDRYTVFTPDGSVFGMSETAQGFNQYIGDDSEIEKGSHLGKRLKSVPKAIEWAVLDRMKEDTFAKGGNIGGYSKIDLVVKKPSGDEEIEVAKFKRTGDAIISANALGKNAPKNYEYYVSSTNKYAKGGMVDLFEDYENIPPKIQDILDRYSEDFEDGNYDGLAKALKEVEANGYTFEYYVDGSAYGLRPIDVPLSDLEGFEEEEFAKGGSTGNFDYMDMPITYTLMDDQGKVVLKTKRFNKAVDTRTSNSFIQKGKLKLVATDNSGNSKVIDEGITKNGEVFAKGGQISTGDWVTYKTDGKRYKVKRVLSNNMLEIASGSNVLIVSIDDVETATKFYRAKFVKVPTNVQVSYKIGDRVKFATKKGEEKGVIKLYKYIPTTNKIMYVIKTDSGWNANVYQDNVALESSASTTTTPKASKKTTTTSASGFAKGDKVVVKDASNLSGIVTEVISANEVAVDVKDSLGITMKIGVITNMTFSTSELEKA